MRILLGLIFSLWATLAVAQGCGPSNPNCIVPNRPSGDSTDAAANTSFINGGGATGVIGNTKSNSITTTYTIQSSDCGGVVNAGGAAFYSVTLPSIINVPINCIVRLVNTDSGRGKGLPNAPPSLGTTILWPLQEVDFYVSGAAWQVLVSPGRWKIPNGSITFTVDPTNGNNANDGLAAGTGNAIQTLTQFNTIVNDQIDTQQQIVSVQFASGTYTNLNAQFLVVGGGTINLVGNSATLNSTTNNVAAINLNCGPSYGVGFGNSCGVIQGFTVTCSGGGNGVLVQTGYWAHFSNMIYGSCPTGSHIQVDSPLARLLLQANYSITGGAGNHLVAIGGGLVDWNSSSFTVTLTGTPAFTGAFAFSEIGGQLVSFNVWSGAATGTKFVANTGGNIFTNSGGINFFPGNAAGTIASGGNYDIDWQAFTPAFTCGTATFTNNSSRWKNSGKTTFIQFDFKITAIGTCTNNVTFTLPNTANSGGTIPTVETAVNGVLGACRMSPASATANCSVGSLAAFLVNEDFVGSGLYENQ